jgi:DNA-binding transcriptional LysR family regulator
MNTRQMKYFCEVVDAGSIVQAAKRLFVAQSAITMTIVQLESELGGELFDRKTRPWELTTLGQFVFPRAKELLRQGKRLEENARGLAAGTRGWISIGYIESTMNSLMPKAIRMFSKLFPDVKMELSLVSTYEQPEQLRNGRIQIGLSRFFGTFECHEDLNYKTLFQEPCVIVLPKDHPLAEKSLLSLPELMTIPFISVLQNPTLQLMPMMVEAGFTLQIAQKATEVPSALGLVAAGLGFTFIPASFAVNNRSDVAFIPVADLSSETSVVAVTMADQGNMLVKALVDILARLAKPESGPEDAPGPRP